MEIHKLNWKIEMACVLASLMAQMAGFDPLVGKIPWRRKWQPVPVLLPGKSHWWRNLVGYSPWSCKELDTTERLHYLSIYLYTIEGASLVAQW